MKTYRNLRLLVLMGLACLFWILPIQGYAQLKIRVSVKLLYNDTVSPPIPPGGDTDNDGVIDPDHCGNFIRSAISCDTEILEKWEYVNRVMRYLDRGYIFEPIEIIHLTNPPAPPAALGTNTWTLASSLGNDTENLLTTEAKNNPSAYAYRTNAINYYVFNANGGGYADNEVATANNDILTTSQGMRGSWPRFLHEIGHYLGVFHTHGRGTNPSDDVCDTLVDYPFNETLDQIARTNFAMNFTNLTCGQQEQVYDIIYNVMSYHADDNHTNDARLFDFDAVACNTNSVPDTSTHIRHRLTTDQLDRMSNRLNNLATVGVVSGRTIFVTPIYNGCPPVGNITTNDCPCDQAPRDFFGNPAPAPATIGTGLSIAATDSKEDIVLIRAGSYSETLTINQPVTLRATRGDVIIGQ